MVAHGSVTISRNGVADPITTLNKGQFFGEVELLDNGRSIANVYAHSETAVEIALLPKDTFHHLLDESPTIQEEFANIAQTRQAENSTHQQENSNQ
jgi:CRP-like cAMP-binding protein